MPYAHTTWSALRSALSDRLGDTTFWTDDAAVYSENQGYLKEALRVWAACAHRWKERVVFNATANTHWYDLTAVTTTPASRMAYSVRDRFLLAEIQYHLIEPVNFSTWTGTEQFTFAEIVAALQRRRNQFLLEAGCHLIRSVLNISPLPAEGRFEIPLNAGLPIIDIRRLSWINTSGVYTQLWRDDEFAGSAFLPNWGITPEVTPRVYSQVATPSLQIQFIPAPGDVGQIEVVGVYAGAALDPGSGSGVLLGVPDNFAWVVKYGAMADLLGKEGNARDVLRAAYCERRWREGCELARIYSPVLFGQVNGQSVNIDAVQQMDSFLAGWQNTAATVPNLIGAAGMNLVALSPKPSDAHSVTLDVLIPAPIPSSDSAQLQLGPEEIDAVLDYAQHIAAFKQGGQEFQDTVPHYENMIRLAALQNERIRACASFAGPIFGQTTGEEKFRPRRRAGETLEV
jgi:hypothetical protein